MRCIDSHTICHHSSTNIGHFGPTTFKVSVEFGSSDGGGWGWCCDAFGWQNVMLGFTDCSCEQKSKQRIHTGRNGGIMWKSLPFQPIICQLSFAFIWRSKFQKLGWHPLVGKKKVWWERDSHSAPNQKIQKTHVNSCPILVWEC